MPPIQPPDRTPVKTSETLTGKEFMRSLLLLIIGLSIPIIFLLQPSLREVISFLITVGAIWFLTEINLSQRPQLQWARFILCICIILWPAISVSLQTVLFADTFRPHVSEAFGDLDNLRIRSITPTKVRLTGTGHCCCTAGNNYSANGQVNYRVELTKENQNWALSSWGVKSSECGNAGS